MLWSDEESSSDDDGLNEDMEALRRAFGALSDGESDSDGDDDLQLVQSIQKRFSVHVDSEEEPPIMKPLCTLMPDWSDGDDIDDDYATLRAIQRRFAAYNDGRLKDNFMDILRRPEQVGTSSMDSEKEASNNFVERTNAQEGFLNCVDTSALTKKIDECDHASGGSDVVECYGRDADDVAGLRCKFSHFPKSALSFFDAIKKNRSCKILVMSKKEQLKARMEELCKLIKNVRTLKDYQVDCKKRTGRALSQKKDPHVQLISVKKLSRKMKLNDNNIPASYKRPPENVHVPKYKEALAAFAIPIKKQQWSNEDRESVLKGVEKQFKEMLFDLYGEANVCYDSSNFDSVLKSINDLKISPERMRSFLPKVNWEKLAATCFRGRTGAECQARFLNYEDPLINHGPWTAIEDKNILHIIQEKGLINWMDIAVSLGTNRTPFQCLARYQRSLNASIMKREWTSEEDNQLRAAVETYGESNWQVVASAMVGRTGTQCSNRWLKTLHPTRVRSGKWTLEEDKRLKVAATLFGPKSWKKVARCVPGRTHVQCRERWVNCLDPSLNKGEWTEEEDLKLEEAISKHGYCWSKVAGCIPHRTDNQCWRRWKVLFPTEVQLLQTARKIQKTALISNFVDRESERPALGPNDFQLPSSCITVSENVDPPVRKEKRPRKNVAATSVALTGDESSAKEYEHFDPIEEQTTADPNLHENPLDAELGGNNATQRAKKASKLQPRRRNSRTLKEVEDTHSKVPRQAVAKSKVKKDKKLKTNDHQSSFSETMRLTDVTGAATEAGFGTKSTKKRNNSERNTSMKLSGSEVAPNQYVTRNTDVSVSVNLDQPENDVSQSEQSGADTTDPRFVYSRRKRERISDQSEQMMVVGDGSRSEDKACRDQAAGEEDDSTLAHFLSKLKRRRSE